MRQKHQELIAQAAVALVSEDPSEFAVKGILVQIYQLGYTEGQIDSLKDMKTLLGDIT